MAWCVQYPEKLPLEGGCVVAIGNFDGVHAGHKALLDLANLERGRLGVPLVVLTFEPHPRDVLMPHKPLKRLMSLGERVEALRAWGVDGVAVFPFDLEKAAWVPARFMEDVLVGWLGVREVCVGENFHFGAKAAGDAALLAADGRFGVKVLPLVRDEGGVVSSTRLRGEL